MSNEERQQDVLEVSVQKISEKDLKDGQQAAAIWCVYQAITSCPDLGINMNDSICVRPCPTPPDTCPDITSLRLYDAVGNYVCTIRVRNTGALHCEGCPQGGHRFVWR